MTRDDKLNGLEHYERFLEAQRFESKEPAAPMTRDKTTNPEGKTAYDIMREMEGGPPKTTNPGAPMSDIAAELERLAKDAAPGPWQWTFGQSTDQTGETYVHTARITAPIEGDTLLDVLDGTGEWSNEDFKLLVAYRNHHATILAALRAAATIGEDHELLTEIDQAKAEVERMREALGAAKQFIENGVELGYIRLPEPPDSALETLPMIRRALAGSATPANQRDATDE